MHVVVVTVVHHPADARILHRQIGALLDAEHEVTYLAPWSATGATPPDGLRAVDVPRARRRHRLAAIGAARRRLREVGSTADVVLLHDPELLLAIAFWRSRPPVVWDVHEDPAAALGDRTWVPRFLRPLLRLVVRAVERIVERRVTVLLAEASYQERFRRPHAVVPNDTPVSDAEPEPAGDDRLVYLGRIARSRGLGELLELAGRLPAGVHMELIGDADSDVEGLVRTAQERGDLVWHGRLANDEALARLEGALAGLSLLHDEPNYRGSRPTKVVEYMSRGVPVITTPNPIGAALVREHGCGVVVPFADANAAAEAVGRLHDDAGLRQAMGRAGYDAAKANFNWRDSGPRFVEALEHASRVPR